MVTSYTALAHTGTPQFGPILRAWWPGLHVLPVQLPGLHVLPVQLPGLGMPPVQLPGKCAQQDTSAG